MPAADFAAAQERIAARRAQRALQHQHSLADRTPSRVSLPFPFGGISNTGRSIWDAIRGREGTRPSFRVGQVDAELLDEELLDLLKGQVTEGLKYFGSHITSNYTPEILLGLRLVLFRLSIWNNDASYGAHLQGLRYTDARSHAPNKPLPTKWQKAAYGLITVGGRYAWTKWENRLLSYSTANDDYTRPQQRSQSYKMKLASRITEYLDTMHSTASLLSFLVFLVDGRYRTLTDRLLRMRLTPASHAASREVSFEYLNRQLVWHAFTEFLLFLLPLVGITRWRRILTRTWRRLRASTLSLLGRSSSYDPLDEGTAERGKGELHFLPERTCAICFSEQNPTSSAIAIDSSGPGAGTSAGGGIAGSSATDITNPYETIPCGCIYCFACVAQRIANEEGQGWTCLRCGEVVRECKPWNGDVVEPGDAVPSTTEEEEEEAVREKSRSGLRRGEDGDGDEHGEAAHDTDDENLASYSAARIKALRNVEPMPDADDCARDEEKTGYEQGLDESAAWGRASVYTASERSDGFSTEREDTSDHDG